MTTTEEHRLTSNPDMWSHDGVELKRDVESTVRYKIRDDRGGVGYITNKHARAFVPSWKISWICNNGKLIDESDVYETVDLALASMVQRLTDRERLRTPHLNTLIVQNIDLVRVEAITRAYPKGITVEKIEEIFGFHSNVVRVCLQVLVSERKVTEKDGVYHSVIYS